MMTKYANWLIPAVIVIILTWLQKLINYNRKQRGKQIFFVILSFLYTFYAATNIVKKREQILQRVENIIYRYLQWKNPNTVIDTTKELVMEIIVPLLIFNGIVMVAFLLWKVAAGLILDRVLKDERKIEKIIKPFYYYDKEYDEWFLLDKWKNVRKIFRALVIAAQIVCVIFFGTIWKLHVMEFKWIIVTPVLMIIVFAEIYHFLNGYCKDEYLYEIMGDDAYADRRSNFYRIREIYEKLFGGELLNAETKCNYTSKQNITDLLKDMDESEDKIEKIVAQFFQNGLKEEKYDVDYVLATKKMLKKQNVVFSYPFYRDLGKYLLLPLMNTLLNHQKCLIVLGRNSTKEDVYGWIQELINEYIKTSSLWKTSFLTHNGADCEIGLIDFSQIYDVGLLENNKGFFEKVGFTIFLEPSLLVTTGQIGVSIIAEQISAGENESVYCIIDRPVEGLVDTMSHLLHVEITDVIAQPISHGFQTGMVWNADGDYNRQQLFDKQTQYMGNGMELAAVAIKNQVPKVSWIGEKNVPIRDIKWLVGQYYTTLCKYMNIAQQQEKLYERVQFISNLWKFPEDSEQFLIVEDEFNNIFGTMHAYLSRGINQTFINVMSGNYLLRDYMRCNSLMFQVNPNSIPTIIPDYAKTERNMLFKLILLMVTKPLMESEILEELNLIGINSDDAYHEVLKLLKKYTYADENVIRVQNLNDNAAYKGKSESVFYITDYDFEQYFAESLKNAYYILEEEKKEKGYIDAKLYGHVTQSCLPGQLVIYDGKYYRVKHVSKDSGVVLRRAAELFDGRKYYRQIRRYFFKDQESCEVVNMKTVSDIEVAMLKQDFYVTTSGFLEMSSFNDFRTARLHSFEGDNKLQNYRREYRNKVVMRIKLPEMTERMRFTLCLLLNEMFCSIFPDTWHYITAVLAKTEEPDGLLKYAVYPVENAQEGDYIYIVEDSDMDLGLIDAVEKNLRQILEIVTDFIYWHFEKMQEKEYDDPIPEQIKMPEDVKVRKSRFQKMRDNIFRMFASGKEEVVDLSLKDEEEGTADDVIEEITEKPVEEAIEEDSNYSIYEEQEVTSKEETQVEVFEDVEIQDVTALDGTDIFQEDGVNEFDEFFELRFKEMGLEDMVLTKYQLQCYLKYGFDEIDRKIQLDEVRKYFTARGYYDSALTKSRNREVLEKTFLDLETVNHCDFCGRPLSGVWYEKMTDGRIRCQDCSSSAINDVNEFRKIFYQTIETMENFFGIEFRQAIGVHTTDAKKIARGFGSVYQPSTEVASRVLGYAQVRHGDYKLFVENGSPRLATILTMVHELTHIWQFKNWNEKNIIAIYGNERNKDLVYEGMAVWVSIQYLYLIGETTYALEQELIWSDREDVYGEGFRLYRDKYPLKKDSSLIRYSPFTIYPPL